MWRGLGFWIYRGFRSCFIRGNFLSAATLAEAIAVVHDGVGMMGQGGSITTSMGPFRSNLDKEDFKNKLTCITLSVLFAG